jgi:uncharacterized membrane protein
MAQQTINLLIAYWLITTIIALYWLIKNPQKIHDQEHFTLFEVFGQVFPCMLLGWVFVPVMILMLIKFKR